jgi:hypothetical protein|tara:strand:+ start:800 stop:1189 length:390 start_codon:yes stop_codon:yes gene_type:complete
MFDFKSPTTQMLGRWQPWHDGHTALFVKALSVTGQVIIMCRDVQFQDAGPGQDDNPYDYFEVKKNIVAGLSSVGYKLHYDYEVAKVPNIVDISYGRGVGYTFTEHDLGKDIHNISATKIRAKLRKEGKL